MFVKSKKFVIPVIAVLVACMAVEADPAANVTLPEVCYCTVFSNVKDAITNRGQDACNSVGQANGAVWDVTNHHCDIGTQSGYDRFASICSAYSLVDSVGEVHYGQSSCSSGYQHVPVPQSCSCTNPSGVNTAAQTQHACTLFANLGTMVGDKCVITNDDAYNTFIRICPDLYPGSTQTCSAQ